MTRPKLESIQRIKHLNDVYEARVLEDGYFPGYYVVKRQDTGQMQTIHMSQMIDLEQKGNQMQVLDT